MTVVLTGCGSDTEWLSDSRAPAIVDARTWALHVSVANETRGVADKISGLLIFSASRIRLALLHA